MSATNRTRNITRRHMLRGGTALAATAMLGSGAGAGAGKHHHAVPERPHLRRQERGALGAVERAGRGNKIERISDEPIATDAAPIPRDRRRRTHADAGADRRALARDAGRAHSGASPMTATSATSISLAGDEATDTLMRGFTTVRDMGGPAFGLKRAIDEGVVAGPRIYPSGAMITVTSGHGDFRQRIRNAAHDRRPAHPHRSGSAAAMVADSPDEVRVRVREQLMQGAAQIKLTAGGGVASPHSPLDVTTFTEAELRAAVEAAENWGTYVTVHAYTPEAIQRAIAAGVKCIEHGHLMDEPTAQLMAEKGIWLSIQPFPEEMGTSLPPGSCSAPRPRRCWPGIDSDLRAGEEIQDQDGVGHRRPVLQLRWRSARARSWPS